MIDLQMLNLILQLLPQSHKEDIDSDALQLSHIQINDEYRKEWNERSDDFVVLTKNGELINNSLYRVGGLGKKPDGKNYFMLLKYVEAYYPEDITKVTKSDPKHLSGHWCILDKNGIEKLVCDEFKNPYLIKDSCVYSIGQNYYNIETGEFYCYAYKSIESSEFIFLDNLYDKDLSKKGVMKINKKDGSWSVFS